MCPQKPHAVFVGLEIWRRGVEVIGFLGELVDFRDAMASRGVFEVSICRFNGLAELGFCSLEE